MLVGQLDDSEEFKKGGKRAAQFAEDFKAEYWSTSSRTGTYYNTYIETGQPPQEQVYSYTITPRDFQSNLLSGENVEELFTRIASVSFEKVMKSEIEATTSIQTSSVQLAQNSSLISELVLMVSSDVLAESVSECVLAENQTVWFSVLWAEGVM